MLERRVHPVDSRDASEFSRAALRTRALRLGLAVVVLALLAAAVASARDQENQADQLLPEGTTGVVVIDLSLSIADEDYITVRRALRRLIAERAKIGLVVFSDVPYELFPPGTPASALQPVLRLLASTTRREPVNPWIQTFRAGTRVSTALDLAQGILDRDNVKSKSIVLISDLETAPDDVPALTRTVERLRQSSTALRVVGLSPSSDARRIFGGLLEEGVIEPVTSSSEEQEPTTDATGRMSTPLLVLATLLFAALAVNEHLTGRLAVTRGVREHA